jgi:hypothetical protein
MKIHANRLGIPFPVSRNVGNINIAAKNPLNLVPVIAIRNWKLKSSPNYRHTKLYNSRGGKLNLFPANGRLAPKFRYVQVFNGFPPVMSLKSLRNQKQMTKNNALNRNKNKINKNIAFLNLLLKSNTGMNMRRRSPSRSPSPLIRRRRVFNNNNNQDPFGPPRSLMRKLGFN